MDSDRIVTIARYDHAAQAHLGRALLEDAGIEAYVVGEILPALMYLAAVGKPVELQVFERDAEEAMALLREAAHGEPQPAPAGAEVPADESGCPHCGSADVLPGRAELKWPLTLAAIAAFVLLLGAWVAFAVLMAICLPMALGRKRRWRCADCSKSFSSWGAPSSPEAYSRIGRRSGIW